MKNHLEERGRDYRSKERMHIVHLTKGTLGEKTDRQTETLFSSQQDHSQRVHLSEYVPTGHGNGMLVPAGQKCPGGHGPPVLVFVAPSGFGTLAPVLK